LLLLAAWRKGGAPALRQRGDAAVAESARRAGDQVDAVAHVQQGPLVLGLVVLVFVG
jgi:hypothetical protein